jgi:hypothetical protein
MTLEAMIKKDGTKNNETLNAKQKRGLALAFFGVVVCLFLNWLLLHGEKDAARGTFGDMFGVVNALFTGLAFSGVVYTVMLQRNELKIQQDELKNSQIELETSKEEANKQNELRERQRFETTFFNMLNLQNEIVKNIQLGNVTGRKVFDEAYKELLSMIYKENAGKILGKSINTSSAIQVVPVGISNARELLKEKYYAGYYANYANKFNHYFRHLYHIYKYIYFSSLKNEDKKFYASLCRAQLSQNELFVIAFNLIAEGYGNPKFLYLEKEYKILKNFDNRTIQPAVYWNLIVDEIEKVSYPFKNREKPINRRIN